MKALEKLRNIGKKHQNTRASDQAYVHFYSQIQAPKPTSYKKNTVSGFNAKVETLLKPEVGKALQGGLVGDTVPRTARLLQMLGKRTGFRDL